MTHRRVAMLWHLLIQSPAALQVGAYRQMLGERNNIKHVSGSIIYLEYTFYWSGKPNGENSDAGEGFAIKRDIMAKLTETYPVPKNSC